MSAGETSMGGETLELSFTLDGVAHTVLTDPKRSALDLLRDRFGIFSLKAGCSPQGVCGCCVAIVDGKPRVTCTLSAAALQGRTVLTPDGLPEADATIYAEAFASLGGTQCGYCTPGIVMQTHALLEKTPTPTREDVGRALNMHICRCTGWVKIHDSVQAAAEMKRNRLDEHATRLRGARRGRIGEAWRPADIRGAVLGRRPFIDDMVRPGLLHGAVVWTPHPRCRVVRIDTSAAVSMPGVRSVCTAADLPGDRKVGLVFRDWPVLVAEGEQTRCVADILAVVAADSVEQARAAAAAVVVEAEALPPVIDADVAATDPANVLSVCRVVRGEAERMLAVAPHVVRERFVTQVVDQAFLEPEASLVVPDGDGGYTVYSCGQGVFDDQQQLVALFGLPPEKLRIVLVPTGGAFGAKEDLNVQPLAILLAQKTGRPVKLVLTMAESTRFHPKRHAFSMDYAVGCDDDGELVAVEAHILGDTGGYASVGTKVLERAAGHACGPYRVAHVAVEATTVRTNNPVCGAMRGFGVNQVAFALEGCLDRLADKLGISGLEIRARNLLRPGDTSGTGQVMNEGCALMQTLDAARPFYDAAIGAGKHVGIACGIKNVGMGNGLTEVGRVELHVLSPTRVRLFTGFTEMGQGHDTVMAQMAAEATGLPADCIEVVCSTAAMVEAGMTTASRATYLGGNAVRVAAEPFVAALAAVKGLSDLVGRVFEGEWVAPVTHGPEEAVDAPNTHYAFGFATQVAVVDAEGRLEEVIAVHDVGRAINRISCEGQIEGGVHMGIGYALSEELVIEGGWPDQRFRNLGIVKAKVMPKVTTLLVEHPDPHGPWGAKGVGEIGLVPTAPAIAEAIRKFDGQWKNRLPMKETAAARAVGVRLRKGKA